MIAETIEPAGATANAALLDLLLTDAALGGLNRVNLGGSGLRAAAGGGSSALAGLRNFAADMASPPRIPSPGSPTASARGRAATAPPACWGGDKRSPCTRWWQPPFWWG